MNLTDSQQRAFNDFITFLNNDTQVLMIKGSAGTGKTTLLKKLIKFLSSNKRSYSLWAPTGRAVKVLEDKTHNRSSTIHRSIYSSNTSKIFSTFAINI